MWISPTFASHKSLAYILSNIIVPIGLILYSLFYVCNYIWC